MKIILFTSLVFFHFSQGLAQKKIKLSSQHIRKTVILKEGMLINYAVSLQKSGKYIHQPEVKKGILEKIYKDSITIDYNTFSFKKLLYLGKRAYIYRISGDSLTWKIDIIEP